MTLGRSKKRESTKRTAKGKPEVHDLKSAYIIPQEAGDQMILALGELPGKYWTGLVGPMIESFQKAFRGDITLTIDPNKPAPPLSGVPEKDVERIPSQAAVTKEPIKTEE